MSFLAAYIVLAILAPIAVSVVVSYRGLPEGRRCPSCAGDTVRLLCRVLRHVPVGRGLLLQRRWCPHCGWVGLARVARLQGAERPAPTRNSEQPRVAAEARGERAKLLDVCQLELDGTCWRVLLRAWAVSGMWRGRLLFVGPHGHLRDDVVAPFTGDSYADVLGQAMALSAHVLAWRLHEVISD